LSVKPIAPRNWKTTNAIVAAKKPPLALPSIGRGKPIPAFNGSQTSRRNKKRPITLPKHA
jgi:hypothetical protein